MQASSRVKSDETYPLRSVPLSFYLRRIPDDRSCDQQSGPGRHAPQIVEFKKNVFEAAEETTKEEEKGAEEIAEEHQKQAQKLPLISEIYVPVGQNRSRVFARSVEF